MEKINKILKSIEEKSKRPVENEKLVSKYLDGSIYKNEPTIFYDWECPPRRLAFNKKTGYFLNFDIDLKKIFRKIEEDKFIEMPRAMDAREKKILSFLKTLIPNFYFVKIVADTNAYYLSPSSLKIYNSKRIKNKFLDFKFKIKRIVAGYPIATEVVLASKFFKNYGKEYTKYFKEALALLKETSPANQRLLTKQMERNKEHLGLEDKKFNEAFSKKVIASYAAEGMIFWLLSQKEKNSNYIWLNMAEADKRTVEMANFLRKKKRIESLPMIFLDRNKF